MTAVNLGSISRKLFSPVVLNRLLRVATYGDSTADLSSMTAKTRIDNFIPVNTGGFSFPANICPVKISVPCIEIANGGVGGQISQQMIDRAKVAYSDERKAIIDICNLNLDAIYFHGGTVNNVINMPTNTTQQQILDVAELHCKLARSMALYGAVVFDSGILGYDGYYGNETPEEIAFRRSAVVTINNYIKIEASKVDGWIFIEPEGLTSTAGTFLTGISYDGVHLSAKGARVLGEEEAFYTNELFKPSYMSMTSLFDIESKFANASGGTPANMSAYATGTSTVAGQACDSASWDISFTTTTSTNWTGLLFYLSDLNPYTALIANDVAILGAEMEVVDSNGDLVVFTPDIKSQMWNATNTLYVEPKIEGAESSGKVKCSLRLPVKFAIGTNGWVQIGVKDIPAGSYTLKLKPPTFRKYIP